MQRILPVAAFGAGLLAVAWVALGYLGTHPLALAMTLLIAAFYLVGAAELRRFHQATTGLAQALEALPAQVASLGDWLARLPPGLQQAVRLRVEGERSGLPGPALTPYIVGLLVLLGMLGTFLGMVVTLNGTVIALQSNTDLAAIRAALAAPVKGLGLAFGTSIAGVAASAMLGLVSALCRGARLRVSQRLDAQIAGPLRPFTPAHQREAMSATLQQQAAAMPLLAAQVQAAMAQMAQQHQALTDHLLAGQGAFHRNAETAYTRLAASVDATLQRSLADSARLAGATIAPAVQAAMDGITRETSQLHARIAGTVQQQLDGLGQRFDATLCGVADRAAATLDAAALQTSAALATTAQQTAATLGAAADQTATLLTSATQRSTAQHSQLAEAAQASAAALAQRFDQGTAALLAAVARGQADGQAASAAADAQRLAAFTVALTGTAATLQQAWQQASAAAQAQQQRDSRALADLAGAIGSQAQAHTTQTTAEVAQLMQAAAEAPRAAAEVIAQLRQQLSHSLQRDNAVLDERSQMLATLGGLLHTVQHAASEQRQAIDALVASSAAMLQAAGERFSATVAQQAGSLDTAAAQLTGSAVEVASLGEAFGVAVQLFSTSNNALMVQLQRIEGALSASTARSDEQLGYYVAQAREVIDLSLGAQKQVIDQLQQLADRPAASAPA